MKTTIRIIIAGTMLMALDLGSSLAATMNDYCIVPPFIQEIAKPNLLMVLDNSASMNDLAYDDRGYKRCSTTTGQTCAVNSDCPSGETCTLLRNPYYCYDETFRTTGSYVGYFDMSKNYQYNFSTLKFQEYTGTIPATCAMAANADIVYCKIISNHLHLNINKADPTQTKYFYASGKFLNWMTASKFDVEKQVLTGGKYVTKVCSNKPILACLEDADCGGGTCTAVPAFLQPESRGCVGMGYVKDVNTADFVNYATGSTNPNTALGLTFLVKGPPNPFNAVAPSTGGQTFFDIFSKYGTTYDYSKCQKAIDSIATGGNADVKQDVDACLDSSGSTLGFCQANSALSCSTSSDCVFPSVAAHCSADASRTCTVATQVADCTILGAKTCTAGKVGVTCTANSDCDLKACSLNAARSCSVNTDCVGTAVLGSCSKKPKTSCSTNADCISGKTDNGPCVGAVAAFNDGLCVVTTAGTCAAAAGSLYTGPCIPASGGDLGPCVTTAQAAATKTKVSFMQSMQACWALRGGKAIGGDDINTVINQCTDIYASFKTCSNNGYQQCSVDADCGAGTCQSGPAAIQPGSPALLCGLGYEGQFFQWNGSAWVLRPGYSKTSTEMWDVHTQFCNDFNNPVVTDPTNPPSTITNTENLPAILSGIGVEAQLGTPMLSNMPVRIESASPPSGLVQEYANKIRIGLMAFNTYGSASESTGASPLLKATRVCSNDSSRVCTQAVDCGPGNTCGAASDSDGAKVLSLVGKGHCSTTTATACTKKAHCPSDESCINDGVGSHTTAASLVSSIDLLRAASWTPFAEAFYNAIGYFAVDTSDSTGKTSRYSAMRLNATDFPNAMNPSEYVCQSNNILLVTDGSSTADLNASKTTLVNAYASESGNITGACSRYAGSQDLDDLAWLAKHRNINTFSTTTASTGSPVKKNEQINTYVVFNGSDNGETGDCNNTTLLNKTANNGGTALLKTEIPEQYQTTLRKAFEQVAGGTASGTAASILSNSEGSGANILQAVFYPNKEFETPSGQTTPTNASWIGEMQNLWYYVDPYIGNSSVRENTADAGSAQDLNVVNDYVVEFQFKGGETIAVLKKDTNGDGSGDTIVTTADDARVKNQGYCSTASDVKCASDAGCPTGETCVFQGIVNADDVNSLWRAGRRLWDRNVSSTPRKLYTYLYGSGATKPDGTTCGGTFSVNGLYDLAAIDWSAISTTNKCIITTLLQASSDAEAQNIIKFAQGYDHTNHGSTTGTFSGTIDSNIPRNRTVQINNVKKTWKLGDIITSTPRIQSFNKLNNFHLDSPAGYGDMTYADDSTGAGYANSSAYKARGMAYAGANDGMLHAFKLGTLNITSSGNVKATLTGTGLGEEQWTFIPKNVLPYLKYLADPAYSHLYLLDGPTRLVDASIGYNDNSYISDALPANLRSKYNAAGCNGTGGTSDHTAYWACKRDSSTSSNKSWRSILIGSMGIGGASADLGASCTNCVKNPVAGAGGSSYFALDITDPGNPQYLWEFSSLDMGFATSGAAVVRVGHKFTDSGISYKDTNGMWFAVIGNGPTGPIDTTYHQFKGKSDNPLRVFVLDLKNGTLLKQFDTTINNAFVGSISSAPIDTDRSKRLSEGFYSDDALYFGYAACTNNCGTDTPTWNGGIMRLLTDESINPDNWSLSTLISNTGPVTTAVSKLQDRKNHDLWLYTGAGRYYFKGDDNANYGKILGVKESCYDKVNDDIYKLSTITGQSPSCTAEIAFSSADFADQTTSINTMTAKKGWFIDLAVEDTTNHFGAERIITEPVAMPNGAVVFTSFMPSTDICNYGGKSFLWATRYDTGGTASAGQLKGKALVQVSTGSFEEVNLSSAFTSELGRKMGTPMIGKPPTDPPPIVSASGNRPLKRILHIQEK
jgi:type IV pilus assembly protein PilY1